jgi:hypothetical protein
VYKQIRALLAEAKKDYVPKDPEKRNKNLLRELENLKDEYNAIAPEYADLRKNYKYTEISYDDARKATLDAILARANDIANELGIQVKF